MATSIFTALPPSQRRQWHPTPVLLPGKSHGRRSLVGCSPWGLEESDMTERLHFHLSLLCIGEGNGNPLRCSCLENPRDGGAWWAAVYGVARSRTWLKRLSSSSSSSRPLRSSHNILTDKMVNWDRTMWRINNKHFQSLLICPQPGGHRKRADSFSTQPDEYDLCLEK